MSGKLTCKPMWNGVPHGMGRRAHQWEHPPSGMTGLELVSPPSLHTPHSHPTSPHPAHGAENHSGASGDAGWRQLAFGGYAATQAFSIFLSNITKEVGYHNHILGIIHHLWFTTEWKWTLTALSQGPHHLQYFQLLVSRSLWGKSLAT